MIPGVEPFCTVSASVNEHLRQAHLGTKKSYTLFCDPTLRYPRRCSTKHRVGVSPFSTQARG